MEKKRSPTLAFIPQHEANGFLGRGQVWCFQLFLDGIKCFQLAIPRKWLLVIFDIHRVPWSTMEYHGTRFTYCIVAFNQRIVRVGHRWARSFAI